MVTLTEIAALVGAVEIITTVFKQRAPGMSLNRMPLFVWAQLVTSFMVIFAMPAVMLGSTMLSMDRLIGHPLLQPGRGRRRAALAAPVLVLRPPRGLHHLHPGDRVRLDDPRRPSRRRESSATRPWCCRWSPPASSAFGVWVHHMFATPLPQLGQGLFTAREHDDRHPQRRADLLLDRDALGRQPRLATPLLFVLGFIALFLIGGLTGVMLAVGVARPAGARHLSSSSPTCTTC